MKRIFTSAATFCALSFSLFSHSHNGQMDDQYQSSSSAPARMTTPSKWQQCLIDKEGWIEGGAEWLFMSSNLTPSIVIESSGFSANILGTTNQVINFNNSEKAINPEYNSGYSLFFRYRGNDSDNDLTVKYHYLRNNGNGSFKVSDEPFAQFVNPDNDNVVDLRRINHDDRGHLHSHMHVVDLMAGRTLPLTYQTLLRLSGGLSFSDFFLFLQQSDIDETIITSQAGEPRTTTFIDLFYKEKHRFWGLGPKGQIDFEYLMLPSSWNHSLNFAFWGQFALLYGKEWSWGKIDNFVASEDFNNPLNSFTVRQDLPWKRGAKHHFYPNINLDFGLNYRWESSYADLIFNLAAGYRVYTYWHLDNLFSGKYFLISNVARSELDRDAYLIYGGPYIRASLAY